MAQLSGPRDGGLVKIVGDDWLDVADLVESLEQAEVVVELDGGDRLRFKTARERLSWVDGVRCGLRMGAGPERILRTLEAGLEVVEAKDNDNRAEAVLLYERLDAELTEGERWRRNEMSRRLKSWNLGSTTTPSTGVNAVP